MLETFKVTIRSAGLEYVVVVEAAKKETLGELKDKAIRKIKKKYRKDVPTNVPLEIEFELNKEQKAMK